MIDDSAHIEFECEAFQDVETRVRRVEGREEVSRAFELRVDVAVPETAELDGGLVDGAAEIVFYQRKEEQRRIHGVVAEVEDLLLSVPGYTMYRLTVVPRAFWLSLGERIEVFVDKTLPEIIELKLTAAGFRVDVDFRLKLADFYPRQEFTMQYNESDLAFVSRLCEHFGVAYFFDHSGGRDVMVFTDRNSSFQQREEPLIFKAQGQAPDVVELRCTRRSIPRRVKLRDYDYQAPQLDLTVDAELGGNGSEHYEYGANYTEPDTGRRIATVRGEELISNSTVYAGKSAALDLAPGSLVTIEDHVRGDLSLLILEVRQAFEQAIVGDEPQDVKAFRSAFRAIPAGVPYRPRRRVPRPRISGLLTGTIDGTQESDYAELDAEGRYRVRFHFDDSDTPGGHASAAIRMAQPHAGPNYGMHFPLRSGVEVIIAFINGDPDRPLIAGCVPNALTPSPVTAGNETRNVMRTGGNNEIYFEDKKGSERIKLSTPAHNTVLQLGTPNASEKGAAILTNENVTIGASGTFSSIGPIANKISAISSNLHSNVVQIAETDYLELVGSILSILAQTMQVGVKTAEAVHAKAAHAESKDKLDKELEDARLALPGPPSEEDAHKTAEDHDEENDPYEEQAEQYLDVEHRLHVFETSERVAKGFEATATVAEGVESLLSTIATGITMHKNVQALKKVTASWLCAGKWTYMGTRAKGLTSPGTELPLHGINANVGDLTVIHGKDQAFVTGKKTRIHGIESVDISTYKKASVMSRQLQLLGHKKVAVRSIGDVYICARPKSIRLSSSAEMLETKADGVEEFSPGPDHGKIGIVARDALDLWAETGKFTGASLKDMALVSGSKVTIGVAPLQKKPVPGLGGAAEAPRLPKLVPKSKIEIDDKSIKMESPEEIEAQVEEWGLDAKAESVTVGALSGANKLAISATGLDLEAGPTTTLTMEAAEVELQAPDFTVKANEIIDMRTQIFIQGGQLISIG